MDFSAWFQVWLGDRWYTFDARHNRPRIGRILMATGRDATNVAISTRYGPSLLTDFKVITDEVQVDEAKYTADCRRLKMPQAAQVRAINRKGRPSLLALLGLFGGVRWLADESVRYSGWKY